MNIPYIDLGRQHKPLKKKILKEIGKVMDSGQFILGETVKNFEERFAEYCQCKYAVGVNSGTDALFLSMKALGIGPGDEVITAPNSFIATAAAIAHTGAKAVFADVRDDMNIDPDEISKIITGKTKAIIPVHLTGRPAEMREILRIARRHNIYVIEDAAQAVGAEYYGKRVGSFGMTGCFSMHPLKNLNACGDGGVITTNNKRVRQLLLKLRNHGLRSRDECDFWGYNSRLDEIQAVVLCAKLDQLHEWIRKRREIAAVYRKKLCDLVEVPRERAYEKSVYHTYIIRTANRNQLMKYLGDHGIETKIHYPFSIHLQRGDLHLNYQKGDFINAERIGQEMVSLPVYQGLNARQVAYICDTIIRFFKERKKPRK
ncbi:DegT/DnrJ/EryC1/StrS family aminotransferase [Fibrobacterota bacterium]